MTSETAKTTANEAFARARAEWTKEYKRELPAEATVRNRSGIEIKPLYTKDEWNGDLGEGRVDFPGQFPYTRGIYATMHRGRTWSQRQLIGIATPELFNERQKAMIASGSNALNLIPCNSGFRGYDIDEIDPEILGTCGVLLNTIDDMDACLSGIDLQLISIGLNDPTPFTYAAFVLTLAKRKNIPWNTISGTSNQSDYLSHYVANHMFFRLALPGSRRILGDHIDFMLKNAPRWNPISIVGQHMQQAGATPAEAMAFTLCSGIQYAEDCLARGMDPDVFLTRFSFFFDISISFFEEIAKFRAGRRIWAKLTRERFGAKTDKACRFRFHAQTSGVDLTRQQPLNNIARVSVQAMAGILGGLQSLHTDAFDEALSTPSERAARIAVNTQNILRDEAGLTDVIDPLGGSYYVEALTDDMERTILSVIDRIDAAGGMYKAVETGLVQSMIGRSAKEFQDRIDSGVQRVVGVNAYQASEDVADRPVFERPDPADVDHCLKRLKAYKENRSRQDVTVALSALAKTAESPNGNVFASVIEAADAGATHGEMVRTLRDVYGFGQPLVQI